MQGWTKAIAAVGLLLAGFGVGAATFAAPGAPSPGAPTAASAQGRPEAARIEAAVEDLLIRRPELVEEALQRLEERRRAAALQAVAGDERHFAIGPKTAAVTIVEFFDYRCPYCKSAADWALDAAKRKDTRVVFVEYPILSEGSVQASRAAVAAIRQGRYLPFHQALMRHKGELDDAAIDALAKDVGLDVKRLRRDMNEPAVDTLLRANHAQAGALKVNGTPAFFVNGEAIGGFDPAALNAALRRTPAR